MSKSHRSMWLRIGVIAALVAAFAAYSLWHTSKSWQFAEVEPGVLYATAIESAEQGVNACERARCKTVIMLMSHDVLGQSPSADVVNFAFHNKVKVFPIEIEEGQFPTRAQLTEVLSTVNDGNRQPALMFSTDGRLSGQVAAVYRLAVLKMPLEEVQKLAVLPDAPPETTRAIQEFAGQYATALAAANPTKGAKLVLPTLAAAPSPEEAGLKPSATAPSLKWSEPDGR